MLDKKGYTVSLGYDEHSLCAYRRHGAQLSFADRHDQTPPDTIRDLSAKGARMAACFASRSLYADIGTFSNISHEATEAHIRATIDKTGLFHEEYALSFCKMHDIDRVKGKYSYLAAPRSDLDAVAVFDRRNTRLDIFCPVEAAVAAAVATVNRDMCITVFEDTSFVRIIGSKTGIIHYLNTISIGDSFDLLEESASRITEMTSLLESTYKDPVANVYLASQGQLGAGDLESQGIEVTPLVIEGTAAVELAGNLFTRNYDFTPEAFHRVKRLAGLSRYSMVLSLLILILSVAFLGLGLRNSHTAEAYSRQTEQLMQAYTANISELENEYAALCANIDCSNINALFTLYRDFESEPKLYTILSTITRHVPEQLYLSRVEVSRPSHESGARVIQDAGEESHSTRTAKLQIAVAGTIKAPYPHSKNIFSSYVTAMQADYAVQGATFNHLNHHADFSLTCEATSQ